MRVPHRLTVALVVAAAAFSASVAFGQDLDGNLSADSLQRRNGAPDCNHNGFLDSVDISRPHFSVGVEHLNGTWPYLNNTNDAQPLDFDNDGDMDLAALSSGPNNEGFIALWRNDGGLGLTWVADIAQPGWSYLWSIRTGDLNGDGRADMVVGDGGWEKVYVVLATGPGTFATPVTLTGTASNNGVMRVDIGDLDNDGDLDIVAPNVGMDVVDVWRNNGNGTFGARASFATGDSPTSVAIGDVTGDGLADIAVANRFLFAVPANASGTVTILRNTGTGFVTHATLTMPTNTGPFGVMVPRPWDVDLVDHDHDGDRDMIVSSDDSQRLDLWTNSGGVFTLAGAIGRGYYLGSGASRFAVADFDGDGWEDVAWGDTEAHAVGIYLNQQNGTFRFRQSFGVGNYGGKSLGVADFDGDGRVDIVGSNDAARTFTIINNIGAGLFDAPLRLRPAEYPSNTMVADFNNDGINDTAYALQSQTATLGIGVYLGNGDATFAATPVMTNNANANGRFYARDVNRDGTMDLLELYGRCNTHIGNGDGTFQAPIVNPLVVLLRHVITDINMDGNLDLVWISPGHPGSLHRSLGDGTGHFGPDVTVGVVPAEDEEIAFGDITGDGAPEIFTGHRQGLTQPGGIFCVYPNNTDGTFGERQDRFIVGTPLSPAVGAITCADFDGDGERDVVVSAAGLRLYRNAGGGALPTLPQTVSQGSASMLFATDIDLDGDTDIYGRAATGMSFYNDGTGLFSMMVMPLYDSNGRNQVIGDVNNDGRLDQIIEPENSWDKYVFLNLDQWSQDANNTGVPDECEGFRRCDSIDFNRDRQYPDVQDVIDFIGVFGGAPCPTGNCGDMDFNNDRQFPDTQDIAAVITVFGGGVCE